MTIDKQFRADLEGTSKGQMLSIMTGVTHAYEFDYALPTEAPG
jgi:hypothetical protein